MGSIIPYITQPTRVFFVAQWVLVGMSPQQWWPQQPTKNHRGDTTAIPQKNYKRAYWEGTTQDKKKRQRSLLMINGLLTGLYLITLIYPMQKLFITLIYPIIAWLVRTTPNQLLMLLGPFRIGKMAILAAHECSSRSAPARKSWNRRHVILTINTTRVSMEVSN